MRFAIGALGACMCMTASALAQTGGPVVAGDVAFGLSSSNPLATAEQVRACAAAGNWTMLAYLQSMEFDNACGTFAHAGNLLALNFGTLAGGGSLYNLSTNGTDAGELIYAFDGSNPNIDLTRVGGLSVNPDNARLALVGYDTGAVIILDYLPSDGSGTGALITAGTSVRTVTLPGFTQGTAWLDNNTILVHAVGTAPQTSDVFTVDATTGNVQRVGQYPASGTASFFTDIDYNPNVSPYVYLHISSFDGATHNTLTAINPNTWAVVKQVDLSTGMNTGREIGLGTDGLVYISSYSATVSTISANPADWVTGGAVLCYTSGTFSSFNGIDVAGNPCGETGLVLSDPVPGIAGQRNDLTCCGAAVGEVIYFAYGFRSGSTKIPGCGGVALDIQSATLAGTARAGADGCATLSGKVSGNMSGRTMLLQAAERTTCTTSNLVQFTFQ